MENRDASLIRKYITLMESIDNKIEKSEEPIDEQVSLFRDAIKTLARTAEVEKGLWQTIKTELPTLGNKYKSAAEFKAAAEAGRISASESSSLFKLAVKQSPELAIKMKGLIRTQPEFAEIAKQVFPKGTLMPANAAKMELAKKTLSQMGIDAKEAEAMLKKAAQESGGVTGVTTRNINKALEKRGVEAGKVANKTGKEAEALAKDASKTADEAAKITQGQKVIVGGGKKYHEWLKKIWEQGKSKIKLIDDAGKVKKYMVSKTLLKWALLAGGAYLIYSLLSDSDGNDVVVVDEQGNKIDPNLVGQWAECLRKLIDNGTCEITQSTDGEPVVSVVKTGNAEYDSAGGLNFYMNGRVWTDDNSKSGSWKCKSGEIQTVSESYMVNEQSDDEMASDVETMIDLLDFPVSGDDLKQANALLSKYAKSSRGKDFLELYDSSGFADASLETSLDYIATFKASSVQAKNNMYKLIKQIESGKVTDDGGKNTGGGNADLSGIQITWDGNKEEEQEPVPVPITPEPERPKYVECSDFPFKFGCKNPKIKEVQRCLGMKIEYQTGNFGPLTLKQMTTKYGTNVIDEITYNSIMKDCNRVKPQPTTGSTVTTGKTVTDIDPIKPKPIEIKPVEPKPAGEITPTKTTTLTREGCKSLFKKIDDRDQKSGTATATQSEVQQLSFCLQQYNFGVGTGANKMKRRYGLTASGGNRGIR